MEMLAMLERAVRWNGSFVKFGSLSLVVWLFLNDKFKSLQLILNTLFGGQCPLESSDWTVFSEAGDAISVLIQNSRNGSQPGT